MYKWLGSSFLSLFLVVGFLVALTTREAHAYIDISSGTLLLQALLASIFGSLFAIKVFWRRIVDSVSRFLSKRKGVDPRAK